MTAALRYEPVRAADQGTGQGQSRVRPAGEPKAALWAAACRSVLRELGIADWWRVRVDEARDGWLVAVDYRLARPAGR